MTCSLCQPNTNCNFLPRLSLSGCSLPQSPNRLWHVPTYCAAAWQLLVCSAPQETSNITEESVGLLLLFLSESPSEPGANSLTPIDWLSSKPQESVTLLPDTGITGSLLFGCGESETSQHFTHPAVSSASSTLFLKLNFYFPTCSHRCCSFDGF